VAELLATRRSPGLFAVTARAVYEGVRPLRGRTFERRATCDTP
jgi:hypothetical protein